MAGREYQLRPAHGRGGGLHRRPRPGRRDVEVATGAAAVGPAKTLAGVAGWRLQVRAADGDGDGAPYQQTSGRRRRGRGGGHGDCRGRRRRVAPSRPASPRVTRALTWDVRVADGRVDSALAAEHVGRLFGSFARAAGLRLHVAAPGVLPAAAMEDARGRWVALRGAACGFWLSYPVQGGPARSRSVRTPRGRRSAPWPGSSQPRRAPCSQTWRAHLTSVILRRGGVVPIPYDWRRAVRRGQRYQFAGETTSDVPATITRSAASRSFSSTAMRQRRPGNAVGLEERSLT